MIFQTRLLDHASCAFAGHVESSYPNLSITDPQATSICATDSGGRTLRQPPDLASRTKGLSLRVSLIKVHLSPSFFSSSRIRSAALNVTARPKRAGVGSMFRNDATRA